jgi:hypothetical protein
MLDVLSRGVQAFLPLAFGLAVTLGLLHLLWRRQAWRWRKLAAQYAAPGSAEIHARTRFQTVILVGGGPAYTGYAVKTIVSLTGEALRLRLSFPWSIHHPPLNIPFRELTVAQGDWFLNTESFELTAARVPGIKMMITGELLDWIAASAPEWQVSTRRRW